MEQTVKKKPGCHFTRAFRMYNVSQTGIICPGKELLNFSQGTQVGYLCSQWTNPTVSVGLNRGHRVCYLERNILTGTLASVGTNPYTDDCTCRAAIRSSQVRTSYSARPPISPSTTAAGSPYRSGDRRRPSPRAAAGRYGWCSRDRAGCRGYRRGGAIPQQDR